MIINVKKINSASKITLIYMIFYSQFHTHNFFFYVLHSTLTTTKIQSKRCDILPKPKNWVGVTAFLSIELSFIF